jgi:CRP/FNR family cyclic AMP-dependent transcriptional regulator
MSVEAAALHRVPLFQGITEAHLAELLGAFERVVVPEGTVLFEAGSEPKHFLLLVSGEVALEDQGEVRFRLTPVAPIGELGAMTGLPRNTTARTTKPSEILRAPTPALIELFERHGDVAFPFYFNLLKIVTDKLKRDVRRVDEMRKNLIRTQKAMKQLRDVVLEAEETPLSRVLVETLEDLIEHNRRGHYMVTPAYALSTSVRLDGGALIPVTAMSAGLLGLPHLPRAKVGSEHSFVLVTPTGEIPMSGRVESIGEDGVVLKLDMLIDAYQKQLEEHLTRVQMLDFIV